LSTFKSRLESGHSKEITASIVDDVQDGPDKIYELMDCFFADDWRLSQRAAWPVGIIGENHPQWMLPFMEQMIAYLKTPKHDAVVRNTVRLWQNMEIPEGWQGEIFELCFGFVTTPNTPIAIKAFSITVCENISKNYPELKEELILAIEDQMEFGSPGVKNRGQKLLKKLKKK
jgi:hypothetical protein